MEKDFIDFANAMNIKFNDLSLLRQAFTHRSYLNEHREIELEHNERLEFLGDAILELVVTDYLFFTYPDKPEGELTAYRAALVNTISISEVAKDLGANDYLLLSRGEAKDTGRARQYILANTFEAIIGAIYLDSGYDQAKEFIASTLLYKLKEIVAKNLWQDAKSFFQEKAQEQVGITPSYEVMSESGPDHNKKFTVGVYLNEKLIATGDGHSKQEAEQKAAKAGLELKNWS